MAGTVFAVLSLTNAAIGYAESLAEHYQAMKWNHEDCDELLEDFKEVKKALDDLENSATRTGMPTDLESRLGGLKPYFEDANSALQELLEKTRSGETKLRKIKSKIVSCCCVREHARKLQKLKNRLEKLDSTIFLFEIVKVIIDRAGSTNRDGKFTAAFRVPKNPVGIVVNLNDPTTMEGDLKRKVLNESSTVVGAVGATGMGGVGKTSALRAIGADKEVQDQYTGGVYFFTLGQNATSAEVIKMVAGTVESTRGVRVAKEMSEDQNVRMAMGKAANWFAGKRCLFICDDLWRTNSNPYGYFYDLKALVPSDSSSCILFSTRDLKIAEEIDSENQVHFSQRPDDVAESMLCGYAGMGVEQHVRNSFNSVLRYCGGLPIALAVAGRAVKRITKRVREPSSAWSRFEKQLKASRGSLGKKRAGGHSGLFHALSASLKGAGDLPEFQNVCGEYSIEEIHRALCVVKKPVWAPYSMLACLWRLTEERAEKLAQEMEDLNLVDIEERDFREKSIFGVKLHDLVHDFCVEEAQNSEGLVQWHARLLEGYVSRWKLSKQESEEGFGSHNWWSSKLEDDNYLHARLTYHLSESRRLEELESLMLNFRWIYRQLKVNRFLTLKDDFELFRTSQSRKKPEAASKHSQGPYHHDKESNDKGSSCKASSKGNKGDRHSVNVADQIELIAGALRLSWPLLVSQESEFTERELAFQMMGRLCSLRCKPAVDKYLRSVEKEAEKPWANSVGPCLELPRGPAYGKFRMPGPVNVVSVIHGMDFVVGGDDEGNLSIFNMKSMETVGSWRGHEGSVTSVAVSGNDQRIVSGSEDGMVRIWDAETGEAVGEPLRGHQGPVRSVAVSGDGQRIVSGSGDGTVRIWNMETGEAVGQPLRGHEDSIRVVAVSGDGQRIVSGSWDGTVRIWNMETGEALGKPLRGHEDSVRSVAVSGDGQRIVSGSEDGTVRIWNMETGEAIGEPLRGHEDWVRSVAVSGDGQRIVSGSENGIVQIWNLETGEAVRELLRGHKDWVRSVAVSGDGQRIVSGSEDGTVRIWNMETGEAVGGLLRGHEDWVRSVAVSGDGQRIVSGSEDGTVRIWNMETGEAIGEPLRGHEDWVRSVAVSGDGQRIVSGSRDGTVRIWNMETGEAIGEPLRGHESWVMSVTVSGDGQRIVSGSRDGTVRIWNMETGEAIGEPLRGHESWVMSVTVSGDDQRIVSGSRDGTVRIWNMETGEAIGEPQRGHEDVVMSVAVSGDDQRIVSGSRDGTVRIWNVETGEAVGEPLERDETSVMSLARSGLLDKFTGREPGNDGARCEMESARSLTSRIFCVTQHNGIFYGDITDGTDAMKIGSFESEVSAWLADSEGKLWAGLANGTLAVVRTMK